MDLNRLPEDDGDGSLVQPECDAFCSICLDPVTRNVERTVVQLKCNHKFHLDCIGSAFNAKLEMECPNCRNVEVGDWLFPNGNVNVPDFDDQWNSEEILHVEMIQPNHIPEMAISIHWCPFEDVAHSATHFNERNIAASSYINAHVHQWNPPSAAGDIQAHVPTSGYTSHSFVAQQMDWVHQSFSFAAGGLDRAEPISSSSPPSIHPLLSPLGVWPYDRSGQPPTRNFIDLVGPWTETGLHISSINQRPFFPPSTEQGHQPRRPYWQ